MIIEASNSKEFVSKLIKITSTDNRLCFSKKVAKIKELGSIDLDYYKMPNGTLCKSFVKAFSIPSTNFFNIKINYISSRDSYNIILSKGIERLVRSCFKYNQVRSLIELIIKGDTQLKNSIFNMRIMQDKWKYYKDKSGTIAEHGTMTFPIFFNEKDCSLWVNETLSEDYFSNYGLFVCFFSLIFGTLKFPIGEWSIINTIKESEEGNIYEIINNTETEYLSYRLIPDTTY